MAISLRKLEFNPPLPPGGIAAPATGSPISQRDAPFYCWNPISAAPGPGLSCHRHHMESYGAGSSSPGEYSGLLVDTALVGSPRTLRQFMVCNGEAPTTRVAAAS